MMIRGRHRGLPYKFDRAIMSPNQDLLKKDELQERNVTGQQVLTNPPVGSTTTGIEGIRRLSLSGIRRPSSRTSNENRLSRRMTAASQAIVD